MSQRIETLKQELIEAWQYLDSVLDQVGNRWGMQVYSDGAQWNVHQLLIHLIVSTQGQTNQVKGIAEGREIIPADFDLERFNRRSVEKRAEMTADEARVNLRTAHEDLLTWLDTVDDTVLEKIGRHASLRVLSVEQILRVIANHDRGHANDIVTALNIAV